MKLERHVGGLSRARKENYLRARGWQQAETSWSCARLGLEDVPLPRAVHHQLTEDLATAMVALGWEIVGFSERGYVKLRSASGGAPCSLPKAMRLQARKEKRPVAELTYSLFLAALVEPE